MIARAAACQQSMPVPACGGEPHGAHPSLWAPLKIVGEGGTG